MATRDRRKENYARHYYPVDCSHSRTRYRFLSGGFHSACSSRCNSLAALLKDLAVSPSVSLDIQMTTSTPAAHSKWANSRATCYFFDASNTPNGVRKVARIRTLLLICGSDILELASPPVEPRVSVYGIVL